MAFTTPQTRALQQLATLWHDRDFVLIGAAALETYLPLNRNTRDLDITVLADIDNVPAGLNGLDGWKRHPRLEHEWHAPGGVQVDVLPAGDELRKAGYIEWPSGTQMSLVGFDHVFDHTTTFDLGDGQLLKIARPHVITFLKMVAWMDRPTERARDLADIAHLLDGYIDDDDERRWSDDALDAGVAFEDVSSFLLGRDVRAVLSSQERNVVARFLAALKETALVAFSDRGPPTWRRNETIAHQRLASFRRGFHGG